MAAEKQIRIFIADGSRDCALLLQSLLEREEDIAVVGDVLLNAMKGRW